MVKIKKVSNSDSLFSLTVIYQDTKSPNRERPEHIHDDYEIVYVYEGKGTFFIDDFFYQMQSGDVFIIPANTIHRATPDHLDPVNSSVVFFGPELFFPTLIDDSFSYWHLFEIIKNERKYKISLSLEQQRKFKTQMERLKDELVENKLGSRQASLLILHEIILYLHRTLIESAVTINLPHTNSPDWVKEILGYINQNLNKKLTLTDLAQQALVSTSHFSRVFRRSTGMRLTVYLNTKRVIKAQELLLATSLSVSYIADLCGFESLTHFHRVFKKYLKSSPSQYRKGKRGF
ncbi:AraC family transcriptional regulator [Bacillus sp. FJAT-27251]|uniref:AraC family transcriptional regulator n=1 Tax=Bacillus sp. FJAT-27251 TaxID=1684142 RepID=UPI0006A7ED72|nr:AraC family transcriptional regulator [Bacillus sp. FJAT-27251]